ncbi:hypothetical protein JI58_07215 [Marinosulfonomonas sp. PRT-SC04]|nr:hypothetical protein JI58_07215 [Marinosulfonomonas sp. PRT-SC04]
MTFDKWTVGASKLEGYFQLEKRTINHTALQSSNGSLAVFGTTEAAQEVADKLNSGEVIPVLPQNRI